VNSKTRNLHALRIEVKKLRYAVEFFEALHARKAVRVFLDHAAELQEILGSAERRRRHLRIARHHGYGSTPYGPRPLASSAAGSPQAHNSGWRTSSPRGSVSRTRSPTGSLLLHAHELMDLILWRHAEAFDSTPDIARRLTRRATSRQRPWRTGSQGACPRRPDPGESGGARPGDRRRRSIALSRRSHRSRRRPDPTPSSPPPTGRPPGARC